MPPKQKHDIPAPPDHHESSVGSIHDTLRQVLRDTNPEQFVQQDGPLTSDQLPEHIRHSDAFYDFVAEYDWPSRLNTVDMTPARTFDSDEAFWYALWDKNDPNYLNNFVHWYLTQPSEEFSLEDTYAVKPALHRVYVVAPELMVALRECMQEAMDVYKPIGHIHDLPIDYPGTVHAAHVAYQLIAKLVTKHDTRLLYDMHLGGGGTQTSPTDIRDTHRYLFM